ncbi:hypothetical protein AGMMS49950_02510 [Endomicrobiia bacterium]|nr:hypothetical protein AGMMS49950_02510 [Endomicrobiia bacterium]
MNNEPEREKNPESDTDKALINKTLTESEIAEERERVKAEEAALAQAKQKEKEEKDKKKTVEVLEEELNRRIDEIDVKLNKKKTGVFVKGLDDLINIISEVDNYYAEHFINGDSDKKNRFKFDLVKSFAERYVYENGAMSFEEQILFAEKMCDLKIIRLDKNGSIYRNWYELFKEISNSSNTSKSSSSTPTATTPKTKGSERLVNDNSFGGGWSDSMLAFSTLPIYSLLGEEIEKREKSSSSSSSSSSNSNIPSSSSSSGSSLSLIIPNEYYNNLTELIKNFQDNTIAKRSLCAFDRVATAVTYARTNPVGVFNTIDTDAAEANHIDDADRAALLSPTSKQPSPPTMLPSKPSQVMTTTLTLPITPPAAPYRTFMTPPKVTIVTITPAPPTA